ncbi:unnamed protein product [Symbiodinium necroappetens]|uniref:Uncharacterized protein n=1 Tax=Symbiodinium necroappetens TaxID=1628268 RepID=A0A812SRX0_9DINO|nr:unnamed protein product [Symbiodinium necroappetens]
MWGRQKKSCRSFSGCRAKFRGAYRCQGDLQEIGSCGLKCQGPECAFSCQGSACAQQCTGDRCGKSCQSGTSGDQSCAKQCKGEECGALCVGATCAKSCEGDFCAAESWRQSDAERCNRGCGEMRRRLQGCGLCGIVPRRDAVVTVTAVGPYRRILAILTHQYCHGLYALVPHALFGVRTAIRAARGPTVEKAGGSVQMKGSVRSVPMAKSNASGDVQGGRIRLESHAHGAVLNQATQLKRVIGFTACCVWSECDLASEFRFSDSRMKFHFSFGFLRLLPCLAYKFREPHIPASQIQYVQELTVALPLAVINLTNCTQLLRDGNLVGGNITFRASDFGHDVPFVMDKAAGFYAILDDVLSRATDGNPCFHEDLRSYMACIVAASCVIQAAVPAYVSMEVYAMILEQVTRFEEITWPLLRDALDHEEGSSLASDILLPEAFVCDGSEHDPSFLQLDSDSHEASQRLISELGTEHTATATMALALRVAAANSHQILDSHATNGSLDATIEKLQHVWHPVCQQLGCDHTNFWDIYLQHHKHSMAVIKTNHAGLLRSDIKLRFHLEQRVQRSQFLDPVIV